MKRMSFAATIVILLASARIALAQVTPAAGYTPPDDTPSIRVGAVIYPDYTYTLNPTTTDADGNTVNFSQFNVSRSYINVTGNISHIVAFRITPDIARETSTFSSVNGSLVFRIKYAYAQFNLDDWMTKGSYARFGIQQTPWLDFIEGIYRYRFQGTMFPEREGYFASADGGASFHYQLPSNYGDVHVGVFNGENYNRVEPNDQKALMVRATVRPFANPSTAAVLRGLRATIFYDGDDYVKNGPRNRLIAGLTFEHPFVNAAFEYLDTTDRTSITKPEVGGKGYSIWATPKTSKGLEALLRYDHLQPNTSLSAQTRNRTIVGVAYWFPHQGTVSSAMLLDYDGQTFDNFAPALPKQSKVAIHGLISF
jgi:opacity protein-like surface antigen